MYGDTFLPNPTTYDELYYELIRVSKVFDDLYTIGMFVRLSVQSVILESVIDLSIVCLLSDSPFRFSSAPYACLTINGMQCIHVCIKTVIVQ